MILKVIENDELYVLVMDLCENGTLEKMLETRGKLHEVEAGYMAIQLISALKYLSQKLILHRDLKLSNLLLSKDMTLKVCDFDSAKEVSSDLDLTASQVGLPHHMAPEMIDTQNGYGYGFSINLWAVGVMMFQLLTGELPWG